LLLTGVSPAGGAVVLAAAISLAAVGLLRRRGGSIAVAVRRHAEARAQLTEAERQAADGVRRREEAVRRCGQIGIDADPLALPAGTSPAQSMPFTCWRRWPQADGYLRGLRTRPETYASRRSLA